MQKKLMIIAVLLLAICNKIAAEDQLTKLTISEFSIFTGQTKDVSISLTNDKAYAAFQFDLVLPEGVTVVMPESPDTWNNHKSDRIPSTTDLSMQQLSDGSYRFVAMPGTTTIQNITGSDGVIINLTLSAAATAAVGNQTGYFRNIKLSTSDGEAANGKTISEQSFTFTVRGDEPYAVLSDENTKLTFYYDKLKDTWTNPMGVGPFSSPEDRGWEDSKETITTVVFDNSFANCTSLTSTDYWFNNCSALTTITSISNLKTDNVEGMNNMFSHCSNLSSIDVTGFKTDNVTTMESMFSDCTSLTNIDITGFNTENVTSMIAMFHACSSLTSIDLSRLNTSKVTDMRYMFRYCSGLTNIDVSKFNTSSAKMMDGMFAGCTGLTSIDLSGLNTTNVESMSSLFGSCTNLTSINLSGLNTASLTDMGLMFDDCPKLTSIDLSSFNTSQVNVMHYLFRYCPNLKTIYVGNNWSTEAMTNEHYGDGVFSGCTSLVGGAATLYDEAHTDYTYARIDNPANNMPGYFTDVQYKGAEAEPYYVVTGESANMTMTFYYDNKKGARGGRNLGSYTGGIDDYDIVSVVFDSSFADYRPTSTAFWFEKLKSLVSITGIEYLNTSEVTDMQFMFEQCSSLISLDLTNFNTAKVTDMKGMFSGCSSLTSLDLSSFDTGLVTDMRRMFENCNAKSINVSSFTTDNVTNMADMFYSCSVESLDLSSFETAKVTDMSRMFYYCGSLTTLDLSKFTTDNVTDMTNMFLFCQELEAIYVGSDGWDTSKVTLSSGMFYGCSNLIGGAGTTYSENKGIEYAHIDGGTSNPGYFTDVADKNKEPYTVFDSSSSTLTFYFDKNRLTNGGTIIENIGSPSWNNIRENIVFVNFDSSFKKYNGLTTMYSWFGACNNLTTINGLENVTTDNVTDMSGLFSGCSKLTSLDLSQWNTGSVTTMANMFDDCSLLENLDISSFNTGNVTTMLGMFRGCSSLSSLNISSFNTAKVERMSFMFVSCSNLTDLNLSNFNTSSVVDMSGMFVGCSSLSTLDLSSFTTTSVTDMYEMFDNCTSLSSLDISSFNTENVTNMEALFYNCNSLASLDLSHFNTSSVTNMAHMFYGCSNLASLDLSEFVTTNVTDMLGMFAGCSSLNSLDLANFNTANVTRMESIFSNCTALTTVYVGDNWTTASVTEGNYAFNHCTHLVGGEGTAYDDSEIGFTYARIDDPANNKPGYLTDVIYKGVEDEPYAVLTSNGDEITTSESTVNGKTLTFYYDKKKVAISDAITIVPFSNISEVGWIGSNDVITKVVFDDSFADCTSLTNTAYWFYGCTNLATITGIGNLKTENVTSMQSMFESCTSLTELDLTGFSTSKVTNMSRMFLGCSGLTSLDLSHIDVSNVLDMSSMFYDCRGLTSLNLSGWTTSKVTTMNSMFMKCSGLTDLDLGSFNTASVTDMYHMFAHSYNLKTIYVGESGWTTSKVENGTEMFYGCSELVGGEGTLYSLAYTNYDYAVVDKGTTKPGYLTEKYLVRAYAVLSNEDMTLTFYYDTQKVDRKGMDIGPFNSSEERGWYPSPIPGNAAVARFIRNVVFDDSFADYRPVSTAYWFSDFASLTSITGLGNLNTSEVTDMHNMFYYCSVPENFDWSKLNTENVNIMTGMFAGSILTNPDFSDFETSQVTAMDSMFCNIGLTTLDLSSFKTEKVTKMNSMFNNCYYLANVNLSSFNTSSVTTMERMFQACNFETIDLSTFNTAKVANMSHMFENNNNLTTIYVDDGWSTESVTSSEGMFGQCMNLVGEKGSRLDIGNVNTTAYYAHIDGGQDNPGYFTEKYTNEAYAVLTDNDDEITTEEGSVHGKTLTFYYDKKKEERGGMSVGPFTYTYDGTYIRDLVRPDWYEYREGITNALFDASFAKCTSLTSTAFWFYGCKNLISIDSIQYLKTDSVKDMGFMFRGCSKLTYLDVSRFNTSNVETFSGLFGSCSSLKSIDVSHFNTSKVTDYRLMFHFCSSLEELDVSNFDTSSALGMGGMFEGCSKLKKLDLHNFNTEKVFGMGWLFSLCSALTDLDISNFITSSAGEMTEMFAGCESLTNIDVRHFDTSNVTLLDGMFSNCSELTSLDLSKFNTENVTNMDNMFAGCSKLSTIYASESWTTKKLTESSDVFSGCTKLIGGKGTLFNEEYIGHTYARIDGGPNSETPGYFTDINAPASYDIKVRTVGNGQVTINRVVVDSDSEEIVDVERGSAVTMVFTPADGYKLESVVVDTIDVTSELETYDETGSMIYTLERIYDYHTVTATFANNTVTLTAKSYTRKYGEDNPTFEYTVEGAEFSGKPTITCEATDTTSVGTYPIVITYTKAAGTRAATNDTNTSESSGVKVVCVNGTLTITKAPLKVAAKSYTIKRGSPIPTFEIEYAGFVNNETETVFTKKAEATCEAKSDTVPGTYQIVVSGAEAKNYEMEFVNGSLTITDDVVVTAKSYTREYGEANPTFEYTVDGAILEGKPAITCEATATSPVGTYDITIAKGDITNSDVTYVKGTLTITKAPLTITAMSYSIKQGKDLPTLELEYTGFKNNETDTVFTTKPTVTTRATSYSNPGTYDIIVSGAEAANYEIKYVNGTLTITEKTETFDGYVLTVNEGGNIDDAFENMGGREECAKAIAAIIWNDSEPLTDEMLKGIDNPNLLVYVSNSKLAPKNVKNVVVNGVAKYISLTNDSTKNCNFYVPEEFIADSIVYKREFKQTTQKNVSRGWEGIVLPFTVQTFSHKTHGEIAPFGNTASKYHFWLHAITENGVIDATTIEANKPYIISMPNSEEYTAEFNQAGLVTFASADVKVPATETSDVWLNDSVVIIPTFQRVEKYDMVYALNVLYDFDDFKEGSVFVSNYRDVRPFEIYTFHEHHHHKGAEARLISVSSLFGGNGTTDIIDVMKTSEPNGESWYDMNGRRLQGKPTRKGVYILNGRKVVIK